MAELRAERLREPDIAQDEEGSLRW